MKVLVTLFVFGLMCSSNAFSNEKVSLSVTCIEGTLDSQNNIIEDDREEGIRVIIGNIKNSIFSRSKTLIVLGKGGLLKSDPYEIIDVIEAEKTENSSSEESSYESTRLNIQLVTHDYTGTVEPVKATLVRNGESINLVCRYPDAFHSGGYGSTLAAIDYAFN